MWPLRALSLAVLDGDALQTLQIFEQSEWSAPATAAVSCAMQIPQECYSATSWLHLQIHRATADPFLRGVPTLHGTMHEASSFLSSSSHGEVC